MKKTIIQNLIKSGVSQTTLHVYLQYLSDNGLPIDCQMTCEILTSPIEDINKTCYRIIEIHRLNHIFEFFGEKFTNFLTIENIKTKSKESMVTLAMISDCIMPLSSIYSNEYYITSLAIISLDLIVYFTQTMIHNPSRKYPNLSNIQLDIQPEYFEIIKDLTVFKTEVNKFIAISNTIKTCMDSYLELVLICLKVDITKLNDIQLLIDQIQTAKRKNGKICIDCEICEVRDKCVNKTDYKIQ